jgi:hypothetical protein
MNERIRQLAEQATSVFENMDGEWYEDFDKEEFAQLIVAECGVALSPMLRDQISRGKAFDLIKKHFGVES